MDIVKMFQSNFRWETFSGRSVRINFEYIFIALFLIIVYQMCAYNIKNLVSLYPYHFEEQSKKPPQEAPKWCLQCDVFETSS